MLVEPYASAVAYRLVLLLLQPVDRWPIRMREVWSSVVVQDGDFANSLVDSIADGTGMRQGSSRDVKLQYEMNTYLASKPPTVRWRTAVTLQELFGSAIRTTLHFAHFTCKQWNEHSFVVMRADDLE